MSIFFVFQIDTSLENLPASERAWVEYFKGKESYVAQLSYGQIKSMVKCVRCGKESATYESFSSLSLDLPSDANRCDLSVSSFYSESLCNYNFNGTPQPK